MRGRAALAALGASVALLIGTTLVVSPSSAQEASVEPRSVTFSSSCKTDSQGYCTIAHPLGEVPVAIGLTAQARKGWKSFTFQPVEGSATLSTFQARAVFHDGAAKSSSTVRFTASLTGAAPTEPSPTTTTTAPTTTTTAPPATTTPTPPPPEDLGLAKEAGYTGSAFWSKFPKANAAGWTEDTFFPIAVFLGKPDDPSHVSGYLAAGVNVYQGVEHNLPLTAATNAGLFVLPQQNEWTSAEVGANPKAVGWFISDECEMGYSGCGDTEEAQWAKQQEYVTKVKAYDDGRFLNANFGNGVARTWWSPNRMDEHVQIMDATSADKYAYTSPDVRYVLERSPDWPGGTAKRSATYGWMIDQMEKFGDPANPEPVWGFVEIAKPYLNEAGAETITLDQFEGAVWSSVIHGADGLSYFDHNNDATNGNRAIIDGQADRRARVEAVNAKVRFLAPVLNSPTYVWNYQCLCDTMTKIHGGSLYVFAGVGLNQSTGAKTFTLPTGVSVTSVTVLNEGRTLTVTDGKFTDTFAAEFTHHVYKIAL